MVSKLSQETIEKIRKMVRDGNSKCSVAKETGLSVTVVCKYTKDLPNHSDQVTSIRGKEIGVLKKLLEKGFALPSSGGKVLLKLRKKLPMIKRAEYKAKSVYYLEYKKKDALKALVNNSLSRVVNFHDLASVCRVLNVDLSMNEKKEMLNKEQDKKKFPIERLEEGGFMSSRKNCQTSLCSFHADTSFFGNNKNSKSEKNEDSDDDFLPSEDDSLVELYIRKYCTLRRMYPKSRY